MRARLYVTREAYADLRRRPSHDAALVSQSLLGETLALVKARGDWLHVEAHNGYRGWVRAWALELVKRSERALWEVRPRARVVAPYAPLLAEPRPAAARVAEAGFLSRLPILGRRGPYYLVFLPGRGPAWLAVSAAEIWPMKAPARPSARRIIAVASRLLGTPYLWGGTSSRGYDCSGLVMRLYEWAGITLPRDARQQAALGYDFADIEAARPGDLLFFAARARPVSHVALALGGGAIFHASRSSVRVETLAPARAGRRGSSRSRAALLRADLVAMFRGGRRYARAVSAPPN